jgi:ketosteroid isomerase-like protein
MSDLARHALARWQQEVLSNSPELTPGLWSPDVVIEAPFARAGRPQRIEGLAAFSAHARAGRESMPVRLEAFEDVRVYRTDDPATIVVEYRLRGSLPGLRRSASAPFVVVLTVDEQGRICRWREYQDQVTVQVAIQAVAAAG